MASVALVCAAVLPTTACQAEAVCPAIGWSNAITVDASALGDDVFVQMCVASACSPAPGATATAPSDARTPIHDGDGVFQLGMTAPDAVTVRVYAGDGGLLDEAEHDLDWEHSDAPCGGPSATDPIVLTP